MTTEKQYRVVEIWHDLDTDFENLSLPKQLENERIDEFIDFFYGNNQGGPTFVIEDDICRRKMNLYQSIAQRMRGRIVGRGQANRVEINKLLHLDEFANVRDVVTKEIIPNWDIKEFVDFFTNKLRRVMNKRQMLGLCEKRKKQLEHDKSFVSRVDDKRNISTKQHLRKRKDDMFL